MITAIRMLPLLFHTPAAPAPVPGIVYPPTRIPVDLPPEKMPLIQFPGQEKTMDYLPGRIDGELTDPGIMFPGEPVPTIDFFA